MIRLNIFFRWVEDHRVTNEVQQTEVAPLYPRGRNISWCTKLPLWSAETTGTLWDVLPTIHWWDNHPRSDGPLLKAASCQGINTGEPMGDITRKEKHVCSRCNVLRHKWRSPQEDHHLGRGEKKDPSGGSLSGGQRDERKLWDLI